MSVKTNTTAKKSAILSETHGVGTKSWGLWAKTGFALWPMTRGRGGVSCR